MDLEKVRIYMNAISELPTSKPYNRYELIMYSDGSGSFGRKNADEIFFTFDSDETLEGKLKSYLKKVLD